MQILNVIQKCRMSHLQATDIGGVGGAGAMPFLWLLQRMPNMLKFREIRNISTKWMSCGQLHTITFTIMKNIFTIVTISFLNKRPLVVRRYFGHVATVGFWQGYRKYYNQCLPTIRDDLFMKICLKKWSQK